MKLNIDDEIYFAKVKPDGVIPTKRIEDGGYDLYSCFDNDYIILQPHETVLIPTGIASAFTDKWVAIVKERGSSGSRGLAVRLGVVDSGYRGELMIGITNTNSYPYIIAKSGVMTEVLRDDRSLKHAKIYPYEKAIAQLLLVEVPKVKVKEVSYDVLKTFESERGNGKLGSSGK